REKLLGLKMFRSAFGIEKLLGLKMFRSAFGIPHSSVRHYVAFLDSEEGFPAAWKSTVPFAIGNTFHLFLEKRVAFPREGKRGGAERVQRKLALGSPIVVRHSSVR
ncbi:MAG: hypothetical protein AAF399_16870, partial [Bacteroidota bacterium]